MAQSGQNREEDHQPVVCSQLAQAFIAQIVMFRFVISTASKNIIFGKLSDVQM